MYFQKRGLENPGFDGIDRREKKQGKEEDSVDEQFLKYICTQKYIFYMWKGHNLEVHCTNIQRKGSSSNEIILHKFKR